jgi:opacity protein-like surface antigen
MKKTLLAVFFSLFISSIASAEIGVNVGVTAQIGSMEAKGEETSSAGTTETSDTEEALFGTAGLFIEKDLAFLPGIGDSIGSRISIGYDNIAHEMDLGTQTNVRNTTTLKASGATVAAGENALKATVTDFQTIYARVNILDWLYLKAGEVTVDIDTEFTKNGVVSTDYAKSHSLDGTILGVGIEQSTDNGLFFRVEYNSYDIDGKSVTNSGTDSKFTAKLKDVSGETARISVGKAF